jgi:hypothetical protein
MSHRQEKAPLTQQALTIRTLAVSGAVVAVAVAATVVVGNSVRWLDRLLGRKG